MEFLSRIMVGFGCWIVVACMEQAAMVSLLFGSGTGIEATRARSRGRYKMRRTCLVNVRLVGMLDRGGSGQVGVGLREIADVDKKRVAL
jgi:hypothetical protein